MTHNLVRSPLHITTFLPLEIRNKLLHLTFKPKFSLTTIKGSYTIRFFSMQYQIGQFDEEEEEKKQSNSAGIKCKNNLNLSQFAAMR